MNLDRTISMINVIIIHILTAWKFFNMVRNYNIMIDFITALIILMRMEEVRSIKLKERNLNATTPLRLIIHYERKIQLDR